MPAPANPIPSMGLLDLPTDVRLMVLEKLLLPDRARVRCVCKLLKGEAEFKMSTPHGAHLVAVTKLWDTVAIKLLTGEDTSFSHARFDISDPMIVSRSCCGKLGSEAKLVIVGIPLSEHWTVLQGRSFAVDAEKPFLQVFGEDYFVVVVEPSGAIHIYSSRDQDWVTTSMGQQAVVAGGQSVATVACPVFNMWNNELLLGCYDVNQRSFVRVEQAPPELVERLLLWEQRWYSYKLESDGEANLTIYELRSSTWESATVSIPLPHVEVSPLVQCVQVGDFVGFSIWSGGAGQSLGIVYNFKTRSFLQNDNLDTILYGFIHE